MILYHHLCEGRFIERPNRFLAACEIRGEYAVCHVKNTGRLRELLTPGARVWLEESFAPSRKTRFDLVCVEKDGRCVNIDSQAPNLIVGQWLREGLWAPGVACVRAECAHGASRFDFAYRLGEKQGFVEVKGVTLVDANGIALFPDAPTERGVKHLRELQAAAAAGLEAGVCFVLQREDARALCPNEQTHPAFAKALREAAGHGVRLFAAACRVTPDGFSFLREVPVFLTYPDTIGAMQP